MAGGIGNLNAVKNPWRTYWRRRALRREDRWILQLVDGYAEGLANDKGGIEQLSDAQCKLIEIAQAARTCWLLALTELRNDGIMRVERSVTKRKKSNGETEEAVTEKHNPHPGFKEASNYMRIEQKCLRDYGLERKRTEPVSLHDYVAAFDAAKANRAAIDNHVHDNREDNDDAASAAGESPFGGVVDPGHSDTVESSVRTDSADVEAASETS